MPRTVSAAFHYPFGAFSFQRVVHRHALTRTRFRLERNGGVGLGALKLNIANIDIHRLEVKTGICAQMIHKTLADSFLILRRAVASSDEKSKCEQARRPGYHIQDYTQQGRTPLIVRTVWSNNSPLAVVSSLMRARSLLVVCLWATAWGASVVAPAGSELQVRLKNTVSSNTSKVKDAVHAVLIAPLVIDATVAIPAGSIVKGTVSDLAASTKTDERASLAIEFNEIELSDGKKVPVKARLVGVDNARESVDEKGRILGILASETLAARIDQGIGKVAQRNAGLAGVLELAKAAVLKTPPTGEIRYEPGTELSVRLLEPLKTEGGTGTPEELLPIEDNQQLYDLVNRQPFQTVAEKPPKPSDVTNLMFIADEESLRRAFEAAGWNTAHQLSTTSILETVSAIAEMRGYKEAPMSTLLLEGRRSDFDFQKQNNTFAKRHHLRIWRRPDTFDGKPVWVCSATHDIGIEFSQENRTFIHTINPRIDAERAKIVSDLLFTEHVRSLALVDRPTVPKRSRNATGDAIETDGRMAVVILN